MESKWDVFCGKFVELCNNHMIVQPPLLVDSIARPSSLEISAEIWGQADHVGGLGCFSSMVANKS